MCIVEIYKYVSIEIAVIAISAIYALVASRFEHGTRPRDFVINWRILHRKPDTTTSVHLIELTS